MNENFTTGIFGRIFPYDIHSPHTVLRGILIAAIALGHHFHYLDLLLICQNVSHAQKLSSIDYEQ